MMCSFDFAQFMQRLKYFKQFFLTEFFKNLYKLSNVFWKQTNFFILKLNFNSNFNFLLIGNNFIF